MNKFLSIAITAIIAGAVAFYGGMRYDSYKSGPSLADLKNLPQQEIRQKLQASGLFGGGNRGMIALRRNGGNSSFIGGEIISKDDKSITIKSQDGGSKIVFLSPSTQINKSTAGSSADLAAGKQVTVNGTANADGSLTADLIQIRPEERSSQNQ